MWLACYSQQEIADALGWSQPAVSEALVWKQQEKTPGGLGLTLTRIHAEYKTCFSKVPLCARYVRHGMFDLRQ